MLKNSHKSIKKLWPRSKSYTAFFKVHGISITVCTNDKMALNDISQEFSYFLTSERLDPRNTGTLFVGKSARVRESIKRLEKKLPKANRNLLRLDNDYLLVSSSTGDPLTRKYVAQENSLIIKRDCQEVYLLGSSISRDEAVRNFLLIAIQKLFNANILTFHASAVDVDGKGIMFPGEKGAGKTSLATEFMIRGAKCLAGNFSFVKSNHKPRILCCPNRMKIHISTLASYPMLSELVPKDWKKELRVRTLQELYYDERKLLVDPRMVWGENVFKEDAELSLVLFPSLCPSTKVLKISKLGKLEFENRLKLNMISTKVIDKFVPFGQPKYEACLRQASKLTKKIIKHVRAYKIRAGGNLDQLTSELSKIL